MPFFSHQRTDLAVIKTQDLLLGLFEGDGLGL